MASSAGVGIALGIAGSLAILAAPFTGGASLYLYAAGTAAIVGSMAIGMTAAQPEPISQVHRQTGVGSDPEMPWEWVYGTVVKGGLKAWEGIGGGDDQYIGADLVLACHPCEELVEIQVGDWCFPLVTSINGDADFNGIGLILNTSLAVDPDVFPATWYVPVKGGSNGDSPWWRNPQDDKNTGDRPHIGIKISYGTQTATETHMATLFGTDYSSVARKFIGHTVVHIILRAHTELGTMSGLPNLLFRIRGKNDVLDAAGANPDYRNNCALVFADYCREQLGFALSDFDSVNEGASFADVANECDDTTWSGAGGDARYTFDGVIRDDMEPTEALQLICEHMAGGYTERGDRVAVFTGTIKPTWSGSPLTYNDLAGDDAIVVMPPDQDAWANTLVVHRVVHRAQDANGKWQLYGKMEPAKVDVTSSTYVTEDGGLILRQDAKYQACHVGRRAKWLAWIALKQMRLGATATFRLKKRASVLERGDVFETSFTDFFPAGTKWQVAGKRMILGPDTFAVEIDAVRYVNAIYTPDTAPTEDAIGVVGRRRSSILPAITGLAADELEDTGQINSKGNLVADVIVSWDLVNNILVRNAGDIRIAWKRTIHSTYKSTTAAGDDIQTVLPGLRQGVGYHIRARAEGTPSAGRTDKPVGKWTSPISFTPDTGDKDLGSPPGVTRDGFNQVDNARFEQGFVGWELSNVNSLGSAAWIATGGKAGPSAVRIITGGGEHRLRPPSSALTSVEEGQRHIFRFWRKVTAFTSGTGTSILQVTYFDGAGAAISGQTYNLDIDSPTGTDSVFVRQRGQHTVPVGVGAVFMRIQAVALNASFTVYYDDFNIQKIIGGTSGTLTTAVTGNTTGAGTGDTWTAIRNITASTPGEPVKIHGYFDARLGDPVTGGLGSDNELNVRIRRFDEDGTSNPEIIRDELIKHDPLPAAGPEWGPWADIHVGGLDETGAIGTYIYKVEVRCNVNGKWAVRNREMTWALDASSTSS